MNQSVDLPLGGVDAVCPSLLCQIGIDRPGGCLLIGACNGIELAAKHIKTLKKFCPSLFFHSFFTGLSMENIESLSIPRPRFEQGQDVWALHAGHPWPLRVVTRLFNPEVSAWYYALSNSSLLFIEDDLSPRYADIPLAAGSELGDHLDGQGRKH